MSCCFAWVSTSVRRGLDCGDRRAQKRVTPQAAFGTKDERRKWHAQQAGIRMVSASSAVSIDSSKCAAHESGVASPTPYTTNKLTSISPGNLWEKLGRPRYIVAPMVDQSELPFRLLTRRYGAHLCYTPMINSRSFVNSATYRQDVLGEVDASDRPLIVQFAGHDPATLLLAARYVEHMCDAVDINLGCPQHIAKRGRYGSYLLEEEDLVVDIVRTLSQGLKRVPVTCKIRLFRDDLPRTLHLVRRMEAAGCALLTVHGRTRFQNKELVDSCNFEGIAAVKAAVRIPVFANGGVATMDDVARCLEVTGADGVMSSEAVLENPALFCNNVDSQGRHVDQFRLAREYLDLAEAHLMKPCAYKSKKSDLDPEAGECPKCVKAHMFKLLFAGLQANHDLRNRAGQARTLREYRAIVGELEERGWRQPLFGLPAYSREASWYYRHRLPELRGDNPSLTASPTVNTLPLPRASEAKEEEKRTMEEAHTAL